MALRVSTWWLQPVGFAEFALLETAVFPRVQVTRRVSPFFIACYRPRRPISADFPAARSALVGRIPYLSIYSVVIPLYRVDVVTTEFGTAI